MNNKSKKFFKRLMNTASPSGYEERGRKVWRDEMKQYADKVKGDNHGNSIASIETKSKNKIMLAGHIDEIAFQIKYIDAKGFCYFDTLGGFDSGIIPGRKVCIHTKRKDVLGVVGRKAIHLIEPEERKKASKIENLCIDIGAKNKKEAEKIISIGDSVTYESNFEELRNDLIVSKSLDDKVGSFIIAEVLKNISKKTKNTSTNRKFKASLYSVATVQEEVGLRGAKTAAYSVSPDIGIAIDVTHATDTPDSNIKKHGDVKIGQGATISRGPNFNEKVFKKLLSIAKKKKIPLQIESAPRPTGTDANVIQVNKSGVATALVSIPCRYMHTFTEVVSMKDIEGAIKLLTEFCMSIDDKTNFIL